MTAVIVGAGAGAVGFLVGGALTLRRFPRYLAQMNWDQRERLYHKADTLRRPG